MGNSEIGIRPSPFENDLFWKKSKHKSDKIGNSEKWKPTSFFFGFPFNLAAPRRPFSYSSIFFFFSSRASRRRPFFFLPQGPIGNWTRSTLSLSVSALRSALTADCRHLCSPPLPISLPLSLLSLPQLCRCRIQYGVVRRYVNNWF